MGLSTGGGYVVRRGGSFAFRIRLPSGLARRTGRTEIVRSLGTSDPKVARLLAATLSLRVERLWSRIRLMDAQNEIARLLEAWFRAELDRAWRSFRSGTLTDQAAPAGLDHEERRDFDRLALGAVSEQRLDDLQARYRAGDYGDGYPVARKILGELDAPIDELDHRFALLAAEAMKAQAMICEAGIRWSFGEYTYRPNWQAGLDTKAFPVPAGLPMIPAAVAPARATPAAVAVSPAPALKAGPTVADGIDDYIHEIRRRTRATELELSQKERRCREFERAFGKDTPLVEITRRDAGRWFQALALLPSRYIENADLKGLGFFQAAEKAKRLGLPPMNPRTTNSYIRDIRGVFTTAHRVGAIDSNPFDKMGLPGPSYAEAREKVWKPGQLERFFGSSLFMGCKSSTAVFEQGTLLLADWRFWTPLIALTSGARVGEIAQLRPCDVREEGGIWYFDLNDEGEKRLKNVASRRQTPIHPELVRIGLLKMAADRLAAGEDKLMPGTPNPVKGLPAHRLIKWMGEQAGPNLIPDRVANQGWHCWRHGFQDLSRAAGNPDSVTDRLAGRTPDGTGGRYGAFGLPMLRDALEKLAFPTWLAAIPARFPKP